MARSLAEIQTRLNRSPTTSPKLMVDGEKGPATTEAVVAYQKANNLTESGIVDEDTLAKLFPEDRPVSSGRNTIQATAMDWVLNYAQSKIVWAAGALVLLVVGWVQTKFGINIPPDLQNWVTTGLVSLGGLLIAFLRGQAKDTPRVAAKTPAVIQKPTEWQK